MEFQYDWDKDDTFPYTAEKILEWVNRVYDVFDKIYEFLATHPVPQNIKRSLHTLWL